MKYLFFVALTAVLLNIPWETNFETAQKNAKQQHKLILLNFSGSDWCGPCIRLHSEIFASEGFLKMASDKLIMFNADFPRNKKNQPSETVKKQNEALADKYNPQGKFPFTVLLDAGGKVIATYDGFPNQSTALFTAEIQKICDANRQ